MRVYEEDAREICGRMGEGVTRGRRHLKKNGFMVCTSKTHGRSKKVYILVKKP
jgi:hypothetical protein